MRLLALSYNEIRLARRRLRSVGPDKLRLADKALPKHLRLNLDEPTWCR